MLLSVDVFGMSLVSSLLAINELVPGDSGGKTAFSEENILGGTAGSGFEILER